MRYSGMMMTAMALAAGAAAAQESARESREASLMMSRYEQALGKLQDQHEKLQSDIRTLQRQNEEMRKAVDAANQRAQAVADSMQRVQNTDILNIQSANKQLSARFHDLENKPAAWGDLQRDCAEIGVKHQQLKVSVKPDGSRGVRYLCFDGKVLHMGSEVYGVE